MPAAGAPAEDGRPGDCSRGALGLLRRRGCCALLCLLELPRHASGGGTAAWGEGVAVQDRGAAPERGLVVDDADVEQVTCPDPMVPLRYEVNQVPWAFLDTWILESEGKELGSIVRTFFSFTGAYRLYDKNLAAWAAAERTADGGLSFTDCAGKLIAAAEIEEAGGLFGSPAPGLILTTANGEVVGKTSAEGTSVSIEDKSGNIFARIEEDGSFIYGLTAETLVIDPDGGGGDPNSIDQRTDPRVLSLLAANRLGSRIGVVLPTGPIWGLILLIGVPAVLCGVAYTFCFKRRRRRVETGWFNSGGDEDYSSGSEDGTRGGGLFFCCSRGAPKASQKPTQYSSRFF